MQFKTLFASSVLAIAAVSAQTKTTGLLGDAALIKDNTPGTTYAAVLGNGTVTGKITFTPNGNGTGIVVSAQFDGFEYLTGPFGYHIHDQPVPSSGNCNGTLAHLDPYQRGQVIACDPNSPATCEVGDLSGKHGVINSTEGEQLSYATTYTDYYISTKEGIAAYIGNRSLVIHKAGGGRVVCANITAVSNVPSGPVTTSPAAPDSGSVSSFGISSVLALGSILAAAVLAL